MAYKDFTLSDLQEQFQIENKVIDLFDNTKITPISPSEFLSRQLEKAQRLPLKSEKARSEFIVTPILLELMQINEDFFTIYSGDSLIVDKEKGLTGECDFILTKNTGTFNINYPIIQIVEAKKHDIELGVPQCAAQLVGAKLYNESKGIILPTVHGCVTTGKEWLFMVLENDCVKINAKSYFLSEIENVMGIFQEIIGHYAEVLA